MSGFADWLVKPVNQRSVIKDWLMNVHYAKTVPSIVFCYGLFNPARTLMGLCAFGPSPNRNLNDSHALFDGALPTPLYELNRLVVQEDVPKNALSWFVAQAIGQLPSPCVIVSYADQNWGHQGYIYQATNWLYTGLGSGTANSTWRVKATGEVIHQRTASERYGKRTENFYKHVERVDLQKKHRYVFFRGSKSEVRRMRKALTWEVLPYPKGDNERYDTGETVGQRSSFTHLFE